MAHTLPQNIERILMLIMNSMRLFLAEVALPCTIQGFRRIIAYILHGEA